MLRTQKEQNMNIRSDTNAAQVNSGVDSRAITIRELNDRLRTTGRGGMAVLTDGVAARRPETVATIFAAVRSFADFNPDNDAWGEHDCASLTVDEIRLIWKIDYYDRTLAALSLDPADPKVSVRVLTVMLADEY
jgi:Protein of unknown function (DUF3768)